MVQYLEIMGNARSNWLEPSSSLSNMMSKVDDLLFYHG